jgi:GABA(A) receptor-associated protein
MNSFKEKFSFEQRRDECVRIIKKYPNRIPVIVEKLDSSGIHELVKKKYLVPKDLSIGQFIYVIRKRIKLEPEKAIYLFVNNSLHPTCKLMSQLYKEQADNDGFLYSYYSGEECFGSK